MGVLLACGAHPGGTPKAPVSQSLAWPHGAGKPWRIVHDGHEIAVFDAQHRRIYHRVEKWKTPQPATRGIGRPRILPPPGRALVFPALSSGGKTRTIRLVFVGFQDGEPHELCLPYNCASSYPIDFHYRTWLEDLDGNGRAEICRFIG